MATRKSVGRPRKYGTRLLQKTVYMTEEMWQDLKRRGNGCASRAVRRMLAMQQRAEQVRARRARRGLRCLEQERGDEHN